MTHFPAEIGEAFTAVWLLLPCHFELGVWFQPSLGNKDCPCVWNGHVQTSTVHTDAAASNMPELQRNVYGYMLDTKYIDSKDVACTYKHLADSAKWLGSFKKRESRHHDQLSPKKDISTTSARLLSKRLPMDVSLRRAVCSPKH